MTTLDRAEEFSAARRAAERDPALMRAHLRVGRILSGEQEHDMPATKKPSKKADKPKREKTAPAKKPKKADGPKAGHAKMSALDAAAKVLADAEQPMNAKEMIEAMAAKHLWTSPGGKTPHATLYSAILKEITTKGSDSRFKKTDRGRFAAKV